MHIKVIIYLYFTNFVKTNVKNLNKLLIKYHIEINSNKFEQ